MAAATLMQKLDNGHYMDRGKRRAIDGDFSKLMYAEHLTVLQRKVLTDYRFRCQSIPGTQEIRKTISHLGFWGSVVYGNGIFMTISPGERHNYLAIRLSRYRKNDPFMCASTDAAKEQRPWASKDCPSLEPSPEDEFHIDVPGYDLRLLLLAQDPLCAANAFFVHVRVILATVLGIRMCPHCPHCAQSSNPCQDALGSSAELMDVWRGERALYFAQWNVRNQTAACTSISLHSYSGFISSQR